MSELTRPRTGLYRVRKGFFGKSILQELINYPSFNGGRVDTHAREYVWEDVKYKQAPIELRVKEEECQS